MIPSYEGMSRPPRDGQGAGPLGPIPFPERDQFSAIDTIKKYDIIEENGPNGRLVTNRSPRRGDKGEQMAKEPSKWYLAGEEVPVNPEVKPKYGIWMEVDHAKLEEARAKRRKIAINNRELVTNSPKVDPRDARIAELEELVTNLRAENAKLRKTLAAVTIG
jgi:hypothetical protein